MKIIIDIPKEYEKDYKLNKFKDYFSRVLCDIPKSIFNVVMEAWKMEKVNSVLC